jgi:hypothetical protein
MFTSGPLASVIDRLGERLDRFTAAALGRN